MVKKFILAAGILAFAAISFNAKSQASLPEGFGLETIFTNFVEPAGILHVDSTRMLVWELGGKVKLIHNGVVLPTPVIDISDEVGRWGDHGMIGAAIDPNFTTNGYIYLYYTVDAYYLANYGTPTYDPNQSTSFDPTMGRITRYTLNTVDFEFAIPNSRFILLGETVGTGIPNCTASHGIGSLIFGGDGSLLVSAGDGNTWVQGSDGFGFNGSGALPAYAYDSLALELGIIREDEFLGAFRAQYLNGLNGKVLRIDPETGLGLPGNPFFDAENVNAARSKIWALGFRNPYRMTLKPGTGFGDLDSGHPGILYVSDVGDWVWEETNVLYDGGQNFGWPLFQGVDKHELYYQSVTGNTEAPNPLAGGNCAPYAPYQNTVVQASQFHDESFPNPCNQSLSINDSIVTFVHQMPSMAFANAANTATPYAVVPRWNQDGEPFPFNISEDGSGVAGEPFTGLGGSGGAFLTGGHFPPAFQGAFIQGDYSGWLREFQFNGGDELEAVNLWHTDIGAPIHISQNPWDGCLYVVNISPSNIKRICYGANLNPVLVATPEIASGYAPLEITFDASESYDPEGDPLTFLWEFPDGSTSNDPIASFTFASAINEPQNFEVIITLSDTAGGVSSQIIPVFLNNTPPSVNILSIADSTLYPLTGYTTQPLLAEGLDAESPASELVYYWKLILKHNTHFHVIESYDGNNLAVQLQSTGCAAQESYWYQYVVTVSDPQGMTAMDTVNLYPDCEGTLVAVPERNGILKVFPNPSEGIFTIASKQGFNKEDAWKVFDLNGKVCASDQHEGRSNNVLSQIDLSHLVSGIYVLQFSFGDGMERIKLVKY